VAEVGEDGKEGIGVDMERTAVGVAIGRWERSGLVVESDDADDVEDLLDMKVSAIGARVP
jgi:hypothetical protein